MIHRPTARAEHVVKRSRFIAEAGPVVSRETAKKRISEVRSNHPDASHVVYAYSYGPERSVQYAMSDDGEPRNTAGRPTLEVLKDSSLTDCIVTVVRYFGGTKLGTGGLVRSYGEATRLALAELPREERILRVCGSIFAAYDVRPAIRRVIDEYRGRVVSETFTTGVELEVEIDEGTREAFSAAVRLFHVKHTGKTTVARGLQVLLLELVHRREIAFFERRFFGIAQEGALNRDQV